MDGARIEMAASIGIAPLREWHQHAEEVLREADMAMYAAKGRGRATSAVFTAARDNDPRLPA